MKRLLPVLACCCLAHAAAARVQAQIAAPPTPTAQSNEPAAYEPQNVEVRGDGRCTTVRPGDTVHYTLTIENIAGVKAVFGDLRLRLGRSHEIMHGDLPVPDFRSFGGGGVGARDTGDGKLYHFAFTVPREIFGGTYHGTEVDVRADQPEPLPLYRSDRPRLPKVEVTRHTRDEVHAYCLSVLSNFGVVTRPAVTNFEPGPVDPPPPPPAPPKPLPLPQPR